MSSEQEETIDGIPLAVGVSSDDRWIDAHSITCALCGGYADERETVSLWERESYPNGEAHSKCFSFADQHSVEEAKDKLDAIVRR